MLGPEKPGALMLRFGFRIPVEALPDDINQRIHAPVTVSLRLRKSSLRFRQPCKAILILNLGADDGVNTNLVLGNSAARTQAGFHQ